ncbi:hypothetical protein PFFCH_00476 [Plasmodium falciparum FCH/4]|uniref:Uncharacterized protein n=1 Tax=Plasmodium falciparum FCH/4 TaxID=1036724 RepID=A0A024VUX7_PLAFA|nr:hypothetical protein PFFCH_00476 [Plasmodium falciparum FCH/4]
MKRLPPIPGSFHEKKAVPMKYHACENIYIYIYYIYYIFGDDYLLVFFHTGQYDGGTLNNQKIKVFVE